MSELRWILIGFGIVLLAAIYLWGRRGNRAVAAGDDALLRVRPEPSMHSGAATLVRTVDDEPQSPPAHEVVPPHELPPVEDVSSSETWRGRLEPTFADAPTEELPVNAGSAATAAVAPTLSSSEAPQSRRVERRKILSLRLAFAPQRIEGAKLQESLLAEFAHGKYGISSRTRAASSCVPAWLSPAPSSWKMVTRPGITMLPAARRSGHARAQELIARAPLAGESRRHVAGRRRAAHRSPDRAHAPEVREFERPPAGAAGRGLLGSSLAAVRRWPPAQQNAPGKVRSRARRSSITTIATTCSTIRKSPTPSTTAARAEGARRTASRPGDCRFADPARRRDARQRAAGSRPLAADAVARQWVRGWASSH